IELQNTNRNIFELCTRSILF
ncbi:hypothetical protein A5805_002676, partial [Enterococcus faecium]